MDALVLKVNDESMDALVKFASADGLSQNDIAYLATVLANSGQVLTPPGMASDVPSTGGPSSLTTIICPLALDVAGFCVPKLGVSGRPAGGIDVLSLLEGYKIDFNSSEVETLVKKNRYIHFIASKEFTPLDGELFDFRKKTNRLAIPSLVIASLLSKKIACGLRLTGLDIRVGEHGNMGKNMTEARRNADSFAAVAALVGIRAYPFLTYGEYAYQPYIGRGESIIALYKIFEDSDIPFALRRHFNNCLLACSYLISKSSTPIRWTLSDLRASFERNLQIQGSNYVAFLREFERVMDDKFFDITAAEAGYFSYRLGSVRDFIVTFQGKDATKRFSDDVGITLLREHGQFVESGEAVFRVRISSSLSSERIALIVSQANHLVLIRPYVVRFGEFEITE